MSDIPFKDACDQAIDLIQRGHDVYQKFTCAGCGGRLTMDTKNTMFKQGTCDKCDTVTNIEARGCGYLVHANPANVADILRGPKR